MSDETILFTSESVNEGHPDKLADQVRAWEEGGRGESGDTAGAMVRKRRPKRAPLPLGRALAAPALSLSPPA